MNTRLRDYGVLFCTLLLSSQAICDAVAPRDRTTDKTAPVWPSKADEELPLAGIFYGNPFAGVATANAGIGIQSSRRFRAERSGEVVSVRYHNRVLTNDTIAARCKAQGKGSPWCNCVDAKLDAFQCGYTLGNSYSVGSGGEIVIELRTDNGHGLPSNELLGATATFIPMSNQSKWFPELRFTRPVRLQSGRIYHLVYNNLAPPDSCELSHVPVEEAGDCPRNRGAIGLNGVYTVSNPTLVGRWGPYRGDSGAANFYRRSIDDPWIYYEWSLSFFELGYADGVAVGESYFAIDAVLDGKHVIEGTVRGRQRFEVRQASRDVDGLWLNFGHTENANGSPLTVELKEEGGSVLAAAKIDVSTRCQELAKNVTVYTDANCRDWGYASFGSVMILQEGATYSVELSGNKNSGFVVSTYQPLSDHGFVDRNHWSGARAEISTDSGKTWNAWTSKMAHERDMALLFTVSGMPRQLP